MIACIDDKGDDRGVSSPLGIEIKTPVSSPLVAALPPPTAAPDRTATTPRTPTVTVPARAPIPVPRPSPTKLPAVTTSNPTPIPDVSPSVAPTVRFAIEMPSSPNDAAVDAPTNVNTTSTSGQVVSSNSLIIGIAIGGVGGLLLAALIVFLIVWIQRKKQTSNETRKFAPFGDPHAAQDASSPPPSSGTTLGMSDTSTIASLVRPPAIYPPLCYPMSDTTSNTTYTTEILEPQKIDAIRPYPVNPLLHVKDQCRDVAFVRVAAPMSLSLSAQNTTTIPVVVPMVVVNMVASAETPAPVSSERNHHSYYTC